MKASKIIFTFLILFAVQFCTGQDDLPKAKLVDYFGSFPCENIVARADNFMVEIAHEPASIGYAVIYPQKGAHKEAFQYENWLKTNTAFRKFEKERLLIIRGEEKDFLQVQFWVVPSGADKPGFKEGRWTFFEKDLSKPFDFTDTFFNIACLGRDLMYYLDFLADNPGTRGNIVLFNLPRRKARKEAEKWLKDLTEDGRISRARFRVFFARNDGFIQSEFWIVPPGKPRRAKVLQ